MPWRLMKRDRGLLREANILNHFNLDTHQSYGHPAKSAVVYEMCRDLIQ